MDPLNYLENHREEVEDFEMSKRFIMEEYGIKPNTELYKRIQSLRYNPNEGSMQVQKKVMDYVRNGNPFWRVTAQKRKQMKNKKNKVTDDEIKRLLKGEEIDLRTKEGKFLFTKLREHRYDPKYRFHFSYGRPSKYSILWDQITDLFDAYMKNGREWPEPNIPKACSKKRRDECNMEDNDCKWEKRCRSKSPRRRRR